MTERRSFYLFLLLILLFNNNISLAQYCNPVVSGSAANTGITNFTLADINNNSPDMQGYVDYTAISTVVYREMVYKSITSTANTSNQDAGIWVDWNQDNDFADPGEKVAGPAIFNNTLPYTARFRVPASATLGTTRLRVVVDTKGNPIDSCTTTQTSGDIEDYTIIIRDTVFATSTQYLSPQFINPAVEKKVLGIEIFSSTNYSLSSVTVNTNGTSNLLAISNAKLFYSGDDYSFANTQFGGTIAAPTGTFVFNGTQVLQPGLNYFWLTYDVNGNQGDVIDAELESIVVNAMTIIPQVSSPPAELQIKSPVCNYNPKRNNIWYFGYQAGIDFNGPSPVPLLNSAMTHAEGSASVADKNGNILFYTGGDIVWDRNHNQMPNGFGLGGHTSTSQAAMILQQPDNDSIYYIFTQEHLASPDTLGAPGGFYYSIVDMSKNGGLGNVIVKKTILLNFSTEKQTAVMHSNKKDIWILCHEFGNNSYYAYLLTATGLKDPVVTNIGYTMSLIWATTGCIKASRDGTKVAASLSGAAPIIGNAVELFDFNATTGILSGLKTLTFALNACPFGIEFSPNNNLLYVSESCSGVLGQYDVTLPTEAQIMASKITLGSAIIGGMELAPDGKIYCAKNSTSIDVINSPDIAGAGCGYSPNAFNLSGQFCYIGLPNNFYPAVAPTATVSPSTSICAGLSAQLTASGGPTYSWLPSPDINSLANYTVTVTPTSNTTYSFVVSNNGSCPDTATVTITVNPLPIVSVSDDDTICLGSMASLSAGGGIIYQWNPTAGLNTPAAAATTASPTVTTPYTVDVSDGNCVASGTVVITVMDLPVVSTSGNATILPGGSAVISANGGGTYSWMPANSLSCASCQSPVATPSVTTTYYVLVTDENGCSTIDSLTIEISRLCDDIYVPNAFSPNGDGQNDVFKILGSCITDLHLVIFDRWGDKVFETNDPSFEWDGNDKGKELNSAVFSYKLRMQFQNEGAVFRKGTISLVR